MQIKLNYLKKLFSLIGQGIAISLLGALVAYLYALNKGTNPLASIRLFLFVIAVVLTIYSIFYKMNKPFSPYPQNQGEDDESPLHKLMSKIYEQLIHFARALIVFIIAIIFDLAVHRLL